jgi:phage gp29-like protein
MVGIKDWFGKLIQRGDLEKSQTADVGTLARTFATHPSRGLTPAKLADILQQAEYGYIVAQHDLFTEM